LEWAPGNILCQSSTSKTDDKDNAIGEHDAKRVTLEQQVEGLIDMDIDPDRVEV
jgi:multiple RNA-binding domain-containing protein 1